MWAERIVTSLLDSTDDMVKHLGRLAVNPAYEFEDAITNKRPLHKTFPARQEWGWEVEIDIKPPGYDFVKTAWITVRYKRNEPFGAPRLHAGGYAPYPIENAKMVAGALHALVIGSRHPIGPTDMDSLYFNLECLRKQPRYPKRGRKTFGRFRESSEGIVKDLLAGAVGFGSFMRLRAPTVGSINRDHLAQRWVWEKNWNHAGEIIVRVFDFGKLTDRPNSMTVSLEWNLLRGSVMGTHTEVNLWDITPSKKVKIVYILRQAVEKLERVAAEAEETMRTVHTYTQDAEMKVNMECIFNRVSHDLREAADGFERI